MAGHNCRHLPGHGRGQPLWPSSGCDASLWLDHCSNTVLWERLHEPQQCPLSNWDSVGFAGSCSHKRGQVSVTSELCVSCQATWVSGWHASGLSTKWPVSKAALWNFWDETLSGWATETVVKQWLYSPLAATLPCGWATAVTHGLIGLSFTSSGSTACKTEASTWHNFCLCKVCNYLMIIKIGRNM